MLELVHYTIIEDDTLKVNNRVSVGKWDQIIKPAKGYIQDIRVFFLYSYHYRIIWSLISKWNWDVNNVAQHNNIMCPEEDY